MKRLLPLLAIVVAAVAAVVIVLSREPAPEAAPVPPAPEPHATTGGVTTVSPTTGGPTTPPPEVRTEPTAAAGRAFASLTVTMRGTSGDDHVSCGAIQTEFAVSMANGDGKVRWTGQARDISPRQYPFDGNELQGITLEPATGLLELGQRQLIRIRGTFDGGPGSRFYVVVSAPNATGTGWVSVEFTCR